MTCTSLKHEFPELFDNIGQILLDDSICRSSVCCPVLQILSFRLFFFL